MTRWMIETNKEALPEVDDFVQGLEELLNTHIELIEVVNITRDLHYLDLCTGLLTGITFIQTLILEERDETKLVPALREALLNLANIAVTFNRRIPDGTSTTEGIPSDPRPDVQPVSVTGGEEASVQAGSEELPEPT